MFIRVNRNARGTEYLQIVRSYRDNGKVKQQILFTLGRLDLLQASGEIDGLVKALARFAVKQQLIDLSKDISVSQVYHLGAAHVVSRMLERLANHQSVLRLGGKLKHEFGAIKARHYSVPARALAQLAANPDVAYVTPDRPLQGLLDQADAAIGASAAATYGLTGAGVGVAVIDSGIGPSDDLSGKVVYEQQFVSNTSSQDAFGHGTHVAGIIAGSGLDSTGRSTPAHSTAWRKALA